MFTMERNGELIGTATHDGIVYEANKLKGTTDIPRVLNFNDTSALANGIYYTLTGIRVGSDRPRTKGIYIFNKQKVMIK